MSIDTVRIGDICEILNGFAFKSENYVESGIRVIRIANVQKGYIEDSTPVFYPEDSTGLDKYMLESGDLLMSLTGNVGRVAILAEEFLPAALNQRVACLRMKSDRVSKGYLYHILNSDYFEQKCIQSSKGVAQKNMSTEWLKDYEIPVYTEEKQAEIVSIFDHLQGIIANRRQELQSLDDLIKARFVEMFGNPVKNTMGWETKPLGSLATKIGSGATPKGGKESYREDGISLIRSMNVRNAEFDYKDLAHISDEQASKLDNVIIEENDVLLNITGASVARSCIAPDDVLPARVNQHVCIIRCRNYIDPIFLNRLLTDDNYQDLLWGIAGSGATREAITKQQVESLTIITPPRELQESFAQFVAQVDKSKVVVQKALDEAQILFDSLMQQYFG